MIARADHDAALAAARSEARAEGEAVGRTQAIARVRTILTCPQAEGRAAQALVFALDSDMSPEVAAKALAASPTNKTAPTLGERGNPAPLAGGTSQPAKEDADVGWDAAIAKVNGDLARRRTASRR
jgi:hypothetical protein